MRERERKYKVLSTVVLSSLVLRILGIYTILIISNFFARHISKSPGFISHPSPTLQIPEVKTGEKKLESESYES